MPNLQPSNSKYSFGRLYPPSVPAFFFFEKKEKELHSSRGALRQDYKFLYQINILHIQIICHSVGIKTAEIPTE